MTDFFVYENCRKDGHQAKVHRADCWACNYGMGLHGGDPTANGKWHGRFESVEDARAAAGSTGAAVRDCRICML